MEAVVREWILLEKGSIESLRTFLLTYVLQRPKYVHGETPPESLCPLLFKPSFLYVFEDWCLWLGSAWGSYFKNSHTRGCGLFFCLEKHYFKVMILGFVSLKRWCWVVRVFDGRLVPKILVINQSWSWTPLKILCTYLFFCGCLVSLETWVSSPGQRCRGRSGTVSRPSILSVLTQKGTLRHLEKVGKRETKFFSSFLLENGSVLRNGVEVSFLFVLHIVLFERFTRFVHSLLVWFFF